jgi:glycosyltransferase involved in cell wall biosynthesis
MKRSDSMVRRLKVVHVQLLPLLSGVQTVTLEEFKRLDKERFELFVICQGPGPLSEEVEKIGATCYFVPDLVRQISPFRDLKAFFALYSLFKRIRPDVVHTHSSKPGVIGRVAAKISGTPVVMHTVHGFAFPAARGSVEKFLYYAMEWLGSRFCNGVVVLKDDDKAITINDLRVPERSVYLIPNGVDVEKYRPRVIDERRELRRRILGIGDDVVAVGMVGRLWRQKNPECLLKALSLLVDKAISQRLHLFFIGDGELRSELERLIKSFNLGDKVTLLGWRTDVPDLLAALDIFVLPSRWEGLSLALLEASSCGLPVVATDIPGNRDAVIDGVDGVLFPMEDSVALAERLFILATSAELRARLGNSGREKILRSYRLDSRVEKMGDLYSCLADKMSA